MISHYTFLFLQKCISLCILLPAADVYISSKPCSFGTSTVAMLPEIPSRKKQKRRRTSTRSSPHRETTIIKGNLYYIFTHADTGEFAYKYSSTIENFRELNDALRTHHHKKVKV